MAHIFLFILAKNQSWLICLHPQSRRVLIALTCPSREFECVFPGPQDIAWNNVVSSHYNSSPCWPAVTEHGDLRMFLCSSWALTPGSIELLATVVRLIMILLVFYNLIIEIHLLHNWPVYSNLPIFSNLSYIDTVV